MQPTLLSSNWLLIAIAVYLMLKIWPRIRNFVTLWCTRMTADRFELAELPTSASEQVLLDAAADDIAPLGFKRQFTFDLANKNITIRSELFSGPEAGTVAVATKPTIPTIRPYDLFFQTRLRSPDGEVFSCETVGGTTNLIDTAAMPHQQSFGTMATDKLWEEHQQRVAQYELAGNQRVLDDLTDRFLEDANQAAAELMEAMVAEGKYLRTANGEYRPSASSSLSFQKNAQGSIASMTASPLESATPEIEAARCSLTRMAAEDKVNPPGYPILFLISFVAFFVAFSLWLGVEKAVFISVIIFIHELGHLLGMRLCGYSNTRIFFLPMLGGVALGKKRDASTVQELIVLFLGPLPGLVAGMAIILYGAEYGLESEWLRDLAFLSCVINYFNLLPVMPLDGGRILNTLFMRRLPHLQFLFTLFSTAALAIGAVYLHSPLLGVFAFFSFIRIGAEKFASEIEKDVLPRLTPGSGDLDETTLMVVKAINAKSKPSLPEARPLPLNARIARVNRIVAALGRAKPTTVVVAVGSAVYALSIALPLAAYLWLYFVVAERTTTTFSAPQLEASQ